jgi:hypothetical protein
MYWEDDAAWYAADVVAYDSSKGQHQLWYHIDENEEWIDLKVRPFFYLEAQQSEAHVCFAVWLKRH